MSNSESAIPPVAHGHLPAYDGHSIVNLAAGLASAFGAPSNPSRAATLAPDFSTLTARLAQARAVYLVLLDGVGCRQLQTLCPGGVLAGHQSAELTSVFPSSTAPAITSLLSGSAPVDHGVPGWTMHEPGLNIETARVPIVRALPMDVRGQVDVPVSSDIWRWRGWMQEARASCTALQPAGLHSSAYSRHALAGARRLGYKDLEDIFTHVGQINRRLSLHADEPRHFTYIYLPQFDSTAHQYGWASDESAECIALFDNWFRHFVERLSGPDTVILATADHGFIDVQAGQQLQLAQFPAIAACLEAPLAGEPRLAYCRVRPSATDRFESLVREQLAHACHVYSSAALIRAGWFGPAARASGLHNRCGTHSLVMRPGFTLTDQVPGDDGPQFIGMHGGIEEDEMRVPLIVV